MTPISYSNAHHNEEYLGDDENGYPIFADKAPVDEEELLCPTSFSRREVLVDEDNDDEDDDDIESIVSRERESIGMCKAMIMFQLTVNGSVRGGKGKKKKKNRRNRTPPRGNIGAVFDGNATDEEG
uniref:Uncharacterized protein n=1 Tax=Skeletonema marinoi TaxID=267567 RepID=A0A7S1VWD2_9STRA|mmetsp:Transcript_731/g.1167  ORF Transcript_731/g.1167 Transcript_731/m.1167 type:complete len:126 (+) Transcript_731:177-554(+)